MAADAQQVSASEFGDFAKVSGCLLFTVKLVGFWPAVFKNGEGIEKTLFSACFVSFDVSQDVGDVLGGVSKGVIALAETICASRPCVRHRVTLVESIGFC